MDNPLVRSPPSICKIRELVKVVSDTPFNVLISGETGTGKEVVARLLHESSDRKKERFIKLNCAALPLTLLESELFGYEKGAFTGADRLKPGKFELASNGVIFLDEIGDMPLALQAKLLEVLQSGRFVRLGGTVEVAVNTWVISSTNQGSAKADERLPVPRGPLLQAEYHPDTLPPLRERKEDIRLLIRYFLERPGRNLKAAGEHSIPEEAQRLFEVYHWPGNVRELSSTVLRLMVGEPAEVICAEIVSNMKRDGFSPRWTNFKKGFSGCTGRNWPAKQARIAPSPSWRSRLRQPRRSREWPSCTH